MNDMVAQVFREEVDDLLSELELSLLELEKRPTDKGEVDRTFRTMHTLKGASAMLGLDDITFFAHEVESVLDHLRAGRLPVTPEIIRLTLSARDQLKSMVQALDGPAPADEKLTRSLVDAFRDLAGAQAELLVLPAQSSLPAASEGEIVCRIRFRPDREIFKRGLNPTHLLEELRELGRCEITLHKERIPSFEEFDPELCYLHWEILLVTSQDINAVHDVFIFLGDGGRVDIELVSGGASDAPAGHDVETALPPSSTGSPELGADPSICAEPVVQPAAGSMVASLVESIVLAGIQPAVEAGVETGAEPAVEAGAEAGVEPGVEPAVEAPVDPRVGGERESERARPISSIRVASSKLDQLVNLVGEMVTAQMRLVQIGLGYDDPALNAVAEEIGRLTEGLRDTALDIRMLPIEGTFNRMLRLVHDLSHELGKEVELVTEGAETELDKTVIERIADPLVHLIRNSIDHGIESPSERVEAGKTSRGTLRLKAAHSGDSVILTFSDDGRGMNREKLRAKGVERGLIPAGAELADREILSLIFHPGFSTADRITSISGRGVGMDVVKRGIEALRGTIGIASAAGQGTTWTLKIPLTLAMIESLLVRIGGERYVLPLAQVVECIDLSELEAARNHGRRIVQLRGAVIPYISLRERFAVRGARPSIEQIVIVEIDGKRIGFLVDEVIGEHQLVIKSIGRLFRAVRGVSGATIMGDGTVALILDLQQLLDEEEQLERRNAADEQAALKGIAYA
ncbi:chemotaxis protein CheA [Geomonas sp. Red32]|uniref:chemotaxis protein CheA n=1 Tax=Geomonas sp. Red32 TaxID=2912856 RepID=UPI00202CEFCF|nr:chemotaxis protein CheA [Geomonas sp. Red32]MCM0083187.1 chemotaxis protein CheA [Geomonas sp. Red32]